MSKFKTKQEFLDEIKSERSKLEELLKQIPDDKKLEDVIDGMSTKDFLAHRTEWGIMMRTWYADAKAGKTPAVPSEKYKWNQLKELNAEVYERYKDVPLTKIESEFKKVHDALYKDIAACSEEELFSKHYYPFTGVSDLATYFNSATASHYRSARRHLQKWWKAQNA